MIKPLTCKLTTPELRHRRSTVIAELKELVEQRTTLSNGMAFSFSSEDKVLDKLIDFIKFERLCCDFLSFTLSVVDDTATLEMTGPEGTTEFLAHELGL